MEPQCPRCGSDAAVTTTDKGGGVFSHTCHFSHGGEGFVTWTETRAVPRRAAASSSAPRAPRTARARTAAAESATSVHARAIDAFRKEVERRGGQATVRRAGSRNEVLVRPAGVSMEFQAVIRSRTSGDFQTSTEYGKVRKPETFPTRFWVFVDLFGDGTNFYVVPEWWIQNDIFERHQAYLEAHEGTRPENDASTHHGIDTARVAQWAGKWNLLGL